MPKYSIKIDRRQLDLQIDRALGKSDYVKGEAYKAMRVVFQNAYARMIEEFNRHTVTQEIEMGPNGLNISDTLGGYGNLFSFIGFDSDDKPIDALRALLVDGTYFKQTIYKNRNWYFQVYFPTRKEIDAVTEMPWEGGNSWAEGIERGISGLSYYMFKRWQNGRSGTGFQLPYDNLEDAHFAPKPYLSEILADFRERIYNKES